MRQSLEYVPPRAIGAVWCEVGPLLEKPIRRAGTHAPEHVVAALLRDQAKLLVIRGERGEERPIVGALVMEFIDFPLLRECRVWLAGTVPGSAIRWTRLKPRIEEWARANGCRRARISGRPGWLRVYRDFRQVGVIMEKSL